MVRMTYCFPVGPLFVYKPLQQPLAGFTTKGLDMSGRPIKRPC